MAEGFIRAKIIIPIHVHIIGNDNFLIYCCTLLLLVQ